MITLLMRTTLLLLLALNSPVTAAHTSAVYKSALRNLEMACLKNQSEPRVKKWPGSCYCLSQTLHQELRLEPRATAIRELNWTRRVFDETLPQAEFEKDPLNLIEMLDDTINSCNK